MVIVDDSATRRAALRAMLEEGGTITVVGEGHDADTGVAAAEACHPAVVTMDLEMPGGGGQQAIEQLMAVSPVPILVLSGHVTGPGSFRALDALGAGALDVFPWPASWGAGEAADLRERIRLLDGVTVMRHPRGGRRPAGRGTRPGVTSVIGIAASSGGPPAVATVLSGLKGVAAPVLVVQHLHRDFMESFVSWMTRATAMPVVLATHLAVPRPGMVYVAPAGAHLRLGADRRLHLCATPARLHTPSADELFQSLAESVGAGGVGVVLTGMGDDGAHGLLSLRRAGGLTIAQDEATSAVWGMPGAAWRLGSVDRLLPLGDVAPALMTARAAR